MPLNSSRALCERAISGLLAMTTLTGCLSAFSAFKKSANSMMIPASLMRLQNTLTSNRPSPSTPPTWMLGLQGSSTLGLPGRTWYLIPTIWPRFRSSKECSTLPIQIGSHGGTTFPSPRATHRTPSTGSSIKYSSRTSFIKLAVRLAPLL